MNIGIVDSELNFNYRLFCKTVSKSANWGFDRFRLYSPKWHTKVQVRRPDGSVVATKDFSDGGFEHEFSFDLSENVANEEYSVYMAGVPSTSKFVQVYAYPSGYGGAYGRNAEITYWDFNQVNLVNDGANGIGRVRFENNPITALVGIANIAAGEINFTNCQLDAETLADALIAIDNSGVLNGSFKYSGNLAAPAERALTAYNNLKDTKGWELIGDVPSDQNLLLDSYPNAKGAYSLRAINSDYTGNFITLRRDSDNLEQSFSLVNGLFPESDILAFTGSGNAYASFWNDVSGNGMDLTQTSASAQPQLVSNGAIVTLNGKPSFDFSGERYFTAPNSKTYYKFLHSQNSTISAVNEFSTAEIFQTIIDTNGLTSSKIGVFFGFDYRRTENDGVRLEATKGINGEFVIRTKTTGLISAASQFLSFIKSYPNNPISTKFEGYLNQTLLNDNTESSSPSTADATNDLSVGSDGGSFFFNHKLQELIIWDLDVNNTAKEEINNFYNTY